MSILTLNMSKFLKCLILINSVIFLNSISIDSYVQKNYGVELNISALQFQRQVQKLIPPTDSVTATFTNSSGTTYQQQLTCTPSATNNTCTGYNDGTNNQFFNYQKFNVTQISFELSTSYIVSQNVVNTTQYSSPNPLIVNFTEFTFQNITWTMNPIPSAQFEANYLMPNTNTSNQFSNAIVQIIGNTTNDKSMLFIQYIKIVIPYQYIDLTKPEPTFGQNTIGPTINLNVNFTNQTIINLQSNSLYNTSCNFVYNTPFINPQQPTLWINGSVTYPGTDPSTTYSYNQNIVLQLTKFSFQNADMSFNQYQSFSQFYEGNATNANQLVQNITIYGQLAPDRSTLNITFLQINFNNVASHTYNFSYIPIEQQKVTAAQLSFTRSLFEPEALGQYVVQQQNFSSVSQSFDNNSWIQTINFDLNSTKPYYIKQANMTKYNYWTQSTTFNLSLSYNVVTQYQFGNGTQIFQNAVNNSQPFPTFDVLVALAYQQNTFIYDPINGITYCNATINYPLTAMFNNYTMYNFGTDSIFISFTATDYYDYPLNMTGGQYFAMIALLLLFLGLVFMFFYIMHSKGQHYQQIQKGDQQGRKFITNQLYDV